MLKVAITIKVLLYGFLAVMAVGRSAAEDPAFDITQWSLSTGANGGSSGSSVFFQSVMNPFVADSGQLMDRASSSSTSFDFWWNDKYGSFLIQGSQTCVAQNPPPFPGSIANESCGSGGGIYFTANADLLLTVDAAYDYNLAGPDLFTRMFFQVYPDSNEPVDPVFAGILHDDTFTHYPAVGTLTISGQAIVPAGRTYLLSYEQSIDAHGNTGATGDGSGYIHFTLQAAPAPAAFFPLALGALALRKRRLLIAR